MSAPDPLANRGKLALGAAIICGLVSTCAGLVAWFFIGFIGGKNSDFHNELTLGSILIVIFVVTMPGVVASATAYAARSSLEPDDESMRHARLGLRLALAFTIGTPLITMLAIMSHHR